MTIMAKNTVSTGHTGNLVLEANNNRSYFLITMLTVGGTIEFGGGGGLIPLAINQFYEPFVCPTGEISIVTTGTYVLHMG